MLIETNNIIAQKSVSSTIDKQLLEEVTKEVKSQYNKFLKITGMMPGKTGSHYSSDLEQVYEDHISTLIITSSKRSFYKDENVIFVVTTNAQKIVNEKSKIDCFLNGKSYYDYHQTFMNCRIQYTINYGKLSPGEYSIQYAYHKLDTEMIEKEVVIFEIIDELNIKISKNNLVFSNGKTAKIRLGERIVIHTDSNQISSIQRQIELLRELFTRRAVIAQKNYQDQLLEQSYRANRENRDATD